MEVIYRSVIKEIEAAIERALLNGRKIEVIKLRRWEMVELKGSIEMINALSGCFTPASDVIYYDGVLIEEAK